MAFSSSASTSEPRCFSIGPFKVELRTWSAISGDTSGVITASTLTTVSHCLIDGMGKGMSAAPTCSGNTATLAFADPVANVGGTAILIGK